MYCSGFVTVSVVSNSLSRERQAFRETLFRLYKYSRFNFFEGYPSLTNCCTGWNQDAPRLEAAAVYRSYRDSALYQLLWLCRLFIFGVVAGHKRDTHRRSTEHRSVLKPPSTIPVQYRKGHCGGINNRLKNERRRFMS